MQEIIAGNPSTVELGNRFSRKLITQWLDVEDNPVNLVFCDGSGDGGIDDSFLIKGDERENIMLKLERYF